MPCLADAERRMALGRVYYLSLRLASAEEPDEPLDDDNSNDDACDSPRGEAALVCVPAILHEIAEDRASVARRGSAAHAAIDTSDPIAITFAGCARAFSQYSLVVSCRTYLTRCSCPLHVSQLESHFVHVWLLPIFAYPSLHVVQVLEVVHFAQPSEQTTRLLLPSI